MRRCHLKGQEGDALHAVLCAAGYNIRWLLRAIMNKGIKALEWLSLRPLWLAIHSDLMAIVRLLSLPALPGRYFAGNPWTQVV